VLHTNATSKESYAHRFAKEQLCAWLRKAAQHAGPDEYAHFCGLSWRVNRGAPHYGVWPEYPLQCKQDTVWDEIDDKWLERPPTRDEAIAARMPPDFILDIAIQHKGAITIGIEIVHKNRFSPTKVILLNRAFWPFSLFEIPAAWVLGQVDCPTDGIPDEFLVF